MFLNHYTVRKQCVHCGAIVTDLKRHKNWHDASRITDTPIPPTGQRHNLTYNIEADHYPMAPILEQIEYARNMHAHGYY